MEAEIKETIFDTTSQQECQLENGIFVKNECHFYEVLTNICIKINFEKDESNNLKDIYFYDGCYEDGDSMKFKAAKVGTFYDFEESVNLEVRAGQDPYMVLSYTRDNLGTDFKVFFWLSILTCLVFFGASVVIGFWCCCVLEKKTRSVEVREGDTHFEMTPSRNNILA